MIDKSRVGCSGLFYQLSTINPELLRKAGRYKLAAPVPKTGSALPRPEHYRRLPPFNHQPAGDPYDHSPVPSAVAAEQVVQTSTAKADNRKQERPTSPPNTAKAEPFTDLLPGSQSCRISSAAAAVTLQSLVNRKGETNETGDPMAVRKDPKPTAPTAQLQAKPCHSNSPGEVAVCVPPGAIRN